MTIGSFHYSVFVLLSVSCAAFAEPTVQPPLDGDADIADSTNLGEDAIPPSPSDMKLAEPRVALKGFKPSPTPSRGTPTAQLQLTSSLMANSDLADTAAGTSANTSTVYFNAATLRAAPKLGQHTRLSASITGAFVRFDDSDDSDYDLLNANLGVLQRLGDKMSGELGWRYSQFYPLGSLTDLQEQGVRLALTRHDPLPFDLFLTSGYEFQANFAGPSDRSRLSHFLSAGLGYNIMPKLQGLLSYRMKHDDFTHRSTNDSGTRHEFRAQLSYELWRNIYVAGSVAYLFGDTVDILRPAQTSERDLDNLSFGVQVQANIPFLN